MDSVSETIPRNTSAKRDILYFLQMGYSAHEVAHILYLAQFLDAFMLNGEYYDFRPEGK